MRNYYICIFTHVVAVMFGQYKSDNHMYRHCLRHSCMLDLLCMLTFKQHAMTLQVKLKNPSLLLQLQSVPPRMPGLTASILGATGYSPQKTLLTTLTRSPSSVRDTMQQSGRLNKSPSQKGAWAY